MLKKKKRNRWSKLTIVGNKMYQKISNLLRKLKIFTTYIRRSNCPYGRGTWSGNDKNNAFQISLTTYFLVRWTKLSLNLRFGWNYIFLMAHQSCHDLQLNVKSHDDCKYRESLARLKQLKFLIICQKNPFAEASSKFFFNFQESIAFEKMRKNENSFFT